MKTNFGSCSDRSVGSDAGTDRLLSVGVPPPVKHEPTKSRRRTIGGQSDRPLGECAVAKVSGSAHCLTSYKSSMNWGAA